MAEGLEKGKESIKLHREEGKSILMTRKKLHGKKKGEVKG